jgi:hypothetical protein
MKNTDIKFIAGFILLTAGLVLRVCLKKEAGVIFGA